jgi:hypothetical protein
MNSEIVERLARIETKLDAALTVQADHETRMRATEKKQWYHSGALALAAAYFSKFGIALPH